MSWAVVGGAAIGLVGSAYSSNRASSAASDAGDAASDADRERLAFERERYDEWQSTYGPVEDRLAAYYETLSPTLRIVQGLEAFEKEKNLALTNLRENLDQRGIGTSGISAQLETTVALSSASERARIRAAAPLEVAKEQLGFLQVGLGQDPSSGISGALSDAQRNANRIAEATARNAGKASGAVVGAFTDFAQAGFEAWRERRAANTGYWDETVPDDE